MATASPAAAATGRLAGIESLRWPLVAVGIATVPVAGVIIALSGTLRDRATLERLFGARPSSPSTTGAFGLRDLTPTVRRVRRSALRRSVVLFVVATLISVLAWYIRTLINANTLVDLLILPLLLAVATSAYMWWIRRRSDTVPFEKQPLIPAVVGIIGALVVVLGASYAISAGIAVAVISVYFFTHPLSRAAVVPLLLMLVLAYVYVKYTPKILRYTALPLDLARRMVAAGVSETLARDPRREVLFLRSFADDDLAIRTHRSMRHSPVELATTLPFERFEVVLTWALWRVGPVCAIGRPDSSRTLQPLGAAREFYSDDTWKAAAHDHIASSALVVLVLGRTEGLAWEIRNVRAQGALGKCLFVVPPVAPAESAQRLAQLAATLGIDSQALPWAAGNGRYVIGVHFDANFAPTLVCCDGRDDLAYQTLIETVGAELASGAGDVIARPDDHRGLPASSTGERVTSALSEVYWDHEVLLPRPTDQLSVAQGVQLALRLARRRGAR